VLSFASTVFSVVNFINDKKDNIFTSSKKEFYHLADVLISEVDSSTIDVQTFKYLFNSIDRIAKGELQKYGFVNLLEDYFIYLLLNNGDNYTSKKHDVILRLIHLEMEQEPFNQLKPDQRRIMKNLEGAINNNDSKMALYNLMELNDVLNNMSVENNSLKKNNNWTITLGIIAILITIMSIIITLNQYNKHKKNDRR
jgi:hypothetical protein